MPAPGQDEGSTKDVRVASKLWTSVVVLACLWGAFNICIALVVLATEPSGNDRISVPIFLLLRGWLPLALLVGIKRWVVWLRK